MVYQGKYNNLHRVGMVVLAGFMLNGCIVSTKKSFEIIPEDEGREIKAIAALTPVLQGMRVASQGSEVLRGVHPKSHGCVAANFTINPDIPKDLQVGLFSTPKKSYSAHIRFSNASVLREPDIPNGDIKTDKDKNITSIENSSRGMAIKVLDVGGTVSVQDKGANNQDFLMINTPAFVFANVRDYLRLTNVLLLSDKGDDPSKFFLPAEMLTPGLPPARSAKMKKFVMEDKVFSDFDKSTLGKPTVKTDSGAVITTDWGRTLNSAKVAQVIKAKTVKNPLEAQYFSASPFGFGYDKAMRFSAIPCGGEIKHDPFTAKPDANFLRTAMTKTMNGNEAVCYNFMVQVLKETDVKGNQAKLIEDASHTVDEDKFPFAPVAKITIPAPQHPESDESIAACEKNFYTPWHALTAHRPLGGINRLRNPVYRESAVHRQIK